MLFAKPAAAHQSKRTAGRQSIAFLALMTLAGAFAPVSLSAESIRLKLPIVRQDGAAVCGPASLAMLFGYYGEKQHTQFDLAYAFAATYATEKRYRESDYISPKGLRWLKYPGTPAYLMNRFLKQFGTVRYEYERMPPTGSVRNSTRTRYWQMVRENLAKGTPLLIMQYWNDRKDSTHYRVLSGFDESANLVYLYDPRYGEITQSREKFFELWEINEKNLAYTMFAFVPNSRPMRISLGHQLPAQYKGLLYASDLDEFYQGQNQYFRFRSETAGYTVTQLKRSRWDFARVGFTFEAYPKATVHVEIRLKDDGPGPYSGSNFCGVLVGDAKADLYYVYGLGADGKLYWWTRRGKSWSGQKTFAAPAGFGQPSTNSFNKLSVGISEQDFELRLANRVIARVPRESSPLERMGVFCKNRSAIYRNLEVREGR